MNKNYSLLSLLFILVCFGGLSAFQSNTDPIPKEKLLRFVEKTDVSGQTTTILERDYTGDLNNLPAGTISKVDIRVNAQTGEISERKLLVLPVE